MTPAEVAAYQRRVREAGDGAMSDLWYSDRALEKQRVADEKATRGEALTVDDIVGIMEPRTQPAEHERCANCKMDARGRAGGEVVNGKRWCGLCYGRGRHEDDN